MNVEDYERRMIRDAMDRLLAGTPIRSDGKLTVKSLAAEAGVKRWLLTHRHIDLQDEFRNKIRAHGTTPDTMRTLAADNDRLTQQLEQARVDLRQARLEINHYTRVIQTLTMELEYPDESANGTTGTLTPINRGSRPKRQGPSGHNVGGGKPVSAGSDAPWTPPRSPLTP